MPSPSPLRSTAPLPTINAPSGSTEDPPPSSSSSSAPAQHQPTGSQANIRAPRIVTFLPANRIVPTSTAWIEAFKTSANRHEQFLAKVLLSHLENGTLELGNPACQSAHRAQYGKWVGDQSGRSAAMVVNFTVREDGQLEPSRASLRDNISKRVVATIRAPTNTSAAAIAVNAEIADASNKTYIDPTRSTVEPDASVAAGQKRPLSVSSGSSNNSPTQAGPSTQRARVENQEPAGAASAPTSAPVVFGKKVSKSIREIVNSVISWDRVAALAAIEQKLGTVSSELGQMVMISQLTTRLASASNKLEEITTWANTATVGNIVDAAVDSRTVTQRRLQDQLAAQMAIPDFQTALDQISDWLPPRERGRTRDISITSVGTYGSPLFVRVFADSRGPLEAIQAIRDHLQTKIEGDRYQALKEWQPQTH